MQNHKSYLKKKNDQKRRTCHHCGKTLVLSEDQKGWRDWCKHVNNCAANKEPKK